MNTLAATFLVVAAACITLAAIHAHVWLRRRDAAASAAFAVLAASVAGMAACEMAMALATQTATYARMLWWYQLPVWTGVVSLIAFVRVYLHAGRVWLGWVAIGLRTLALVVNFLSTPSIHYREITSLAKVTLLGDDVAVAQGVPNPWLAIAHLSLAALIVFLADASWSLWRRGGSRKAVTIGANLVLFVTSSTLMIGAVVWGGAKLPVCASLFFLPIVVAMALELSSDLIRAARLATELDAKTAALAASERRLALAADAASAGLWSVDPRTGRVWATPRALAMFGLPPEAGHHIDDVLRSVHPDDRERVREFATHATPAPDERTAIEYRVPDGSGGYRWYASLGRAHADARDAAGEIMGATIDITERKRGEDETARQRTQLEHLSRVATLSELSGALAHEINQPLAIVMSNAEAAQRILQQSQPDLDEVRAILADIVAADDRAGEIIRRMRGLLKRSEPNRQPLCLNTVVADVLKFMRADLLRRGVTVRLALSEPLPDVAADRVLIEQVLINIVGNACDAMAANARGDRTLAIATDADARSVNLRVSDRGTGLPSSPEQVFAPFYTTKAEGLGMGLAISRSIISTHDGTLRAAANADRGATLHIAMPRPGDRA